MATFSGGFSGFEDKGRNSSGDGTLQRQIRRPRPAVSARGPTRLRGTRGFGGNGATMFFLIFSMMAAVVGVTSKFAGGNHIRAWRNDSLAAAGATSIVSWALTVLAFGLACKEINIGGWRGWRLKILEAFIIILTFTELLYLLLLHAGLYSTRYGPGYRGTDYALGGAGGVDPVHKGTTGVAGSRI
ncbi:hypothetical protein LWI29_031496 [Acer saccharum]|uniref:Uncharacterized protein n=2 Tax=Acer TaxID=4022 RepID=A0AA39TX61_ACESA|nr:hypothetical protein LWI29_031496 [Acer saccharum]